MISPRSSATAASLTLALTLGLAGCASSSSGGSGPPRGGPPVETETLVGKVEPLRAGSLTAADVASDETAFGLALYDRLCAAAPTANLTISPASAAEALGMLDAGSNGSTRAAVSHLLRLPGWNQALVAALHDQSSALAHVPQVTVTNHVFEETGLSPTARTLNDLATAYAADLRQVEFNSEPGATDTINAVIKHDTAGMIPKLFDQPLAGDTRTVLANAILLDAKWRHPFPTASAGPFHTASGTQVSAQMMSDSDATFAGRQSAGWQSVVLPYVGTLQAVAILPPAGASNCAAPSTGTLAALSGGPAHNVQATLPKLNLSQTLPLTNVLSSMGLPLSGDYSGLGAGDTQISEVVQKVVMKVDQSGTKAAAATGIAVGTMARVGGQTVTFDRPFFLLLEDQATHTPLFLTRVADPSQP